MTIEAEPLWVLGYGSLIFKPPPHTQYRINGYINGFVRRFWQSSSDHRGTPESPGRVVTLVTLDDIRAHPEFQKDVARYEVRDKRVEDVTEADLTIWGSIYYIPPTHATEVSNYLDVREQDGYTTHKVHFNMVLSESQKLDTSLLDQIKHLPRNDKGEPVIESLVYIGKVDNQSFVGPETVEETARVIATSVGPSGRNVEYLEGIHQSMDEFGLEDSYITELTAKVAELTK